MACKIIRVVRPAKSDAERGLDVRRSHAPNAVPSTDGLIRLKN